MTTAPEDYRHRGARALVILHDRHMRIFLATWRAASSAGIELPVTDNVHYASLAALLRHVLRASRGYMVWMTGRLELPDPGIDDPPEVEHVEERADAYLEHLLERWREPLREVPPERFEDRTYPNWGLEYSVDALLEHAVMHPIRHTFQLEELLGERLS